MEHNMRNFSNELVAPAGFSAPTEIRLAELCLAEICEANSDHSFEKFFKQVDPAPDHFLDFDPHVLSLAFINVPLSASEKAPKTYPEEAYFQFEASPDIFKSHSLDESLFEFSSDALEPSLEPSVDQDGISQPNSHHYSDPLNNYSTYQPENTVRAASEESFDIERYSKEEPEQFPSNSTNESDFSVPLPSSWGFEKYVSYDANEAATTELGDAVDDSDMLGIVSEPNGQETSLKYFGEAVEDKSFNDFFEGSYFLETQTPASELERPRRGRRSVYTKPKFVSGRFKLTEKGKQLNLTISDSSIQCLSVTINYNGYSGVMQRKPTISKNMVNYAVKPKQGVTSEASLIELYDPKCENGSPPPISALWQRIKYNRDISELDGTVTSILYKRSSIYGQNNPYEPQHYRFELDEYGEILNESKCGLCPYCEKVKFLPFKNSSYLSHLTLEHGIFSNNYLTPEGIYYGRYLITKNTSSVDEFSLESLPDPSVDSRNDCTGRKNQHRPRETDGLVCPACYDVIEVGCWKMKLNPLLSYFRHFKKHHKNLTSQKANFHSNPTLTISKRGRKLQVFDR